ncbi:hypothetical protein [Streptomyces sioyaensis]|uniref:hypothetical protein n=1 Tax=Streptomyces TaxID=1883 RepID=UPI0036E79DA7
MPIFQAVVRVRHEGVNLASEEAREALDRITERLSRFGATGQLSEGVSEFTLSLPAYAIPGASQSAAQHVEGAFLGAGYGRRFHVVRVDAWEREEWLREQGLEAE